MIYLGYGTGLGCCWHSSPRHPQGHGRESSCQRHRSKQTDQERSHFNGNQSDEGAEPPKPGQFQGGFHGGDASVRGDGVHGGWPSD